MKKNKYTPKKFCSSSECDYFIEFAELIYDLRFDEKPEYGKLRFILEKNLMDVDLYPSRVFDWTIKIKNGDFNSIND